MFKFSWNTFWQGANVADEPHRWRHDPLGHPDVMGMNERSLADLVVPAELPRPASGLLQRRAADPTRFAYAEPCRC